MVTGFIVMNLDLVTRNTLILANGEISVKKRVKEMDNSYLILIKSVLYYTLFDEGLSALAASPVRVGGFFSLAEKSELFKRN